MAVIAKFVSEVRPGRFSDFMAKLREAAGRRFESPVMPTSVRLFRSPVPGPDTSSVQLFIEHADMGAYGARTAFEQGNAEWRELFAELPDSPQKLVSVERLSELSPGAPL